MFSKHLRGNRRWVPLSGFGRVLKSDPREKFFLVALPLVSSACGRQKYVPCIQLASPLVSKRSLFFFSFFKFRYFSRRPSTSLVCYTAVFSVAWYRLTVTPSKKKCKPFNTESLESGEIKEDEYTKSLAKNQVCAIISYARCWEKRFTQILWSFILHESRNSEELLVTSCENRE